VRVAEHIFVQDGALRSACYDTKKGECWPLSTDELRLLTHLALGRPPKESGIGGGEALKLMVTMRSRGWLVPGKPRKKDLNLPFPPKSHPPQRLNHVWLELTQSCNLTCAHCYANSGPMVNRSNELSLSEWTEIVNDVLNYGIDIITFIGGEPTIRLDVAEAISRLVREKSPQTRLRMFSNFAVPSRTRSMVPFVKSFGIEIGTAIYGMTAESHDRMTGVSGSFSRTLQLIEEMKDSGINVFVGMYVDLKEPGMERRCNDWIKSIGVDKFEVIAPSQVGRGTIKVWRNSKSKNSNQKILSFTSRHLAQAKNGHNCFLDHFVVKPNGDLSPCIMMRSVHYGNKKALSVKEILNTNEYKAAAGLTKDAIEGCSSCEFRYACFDCRPDAMAGHKELTRKPACGYDPRLPLGVELNE
jgi:radical SAM protein with 4Fe4S-binding SPASM domain